MAKAPCDAICVGALESSTGRDILRRLAGRAAMMLGEGMKICSDSGMFCLAPGTGTVSFMGNLHAIALGGLRIARGAAAGRS